MLLSILRLYVFFPTLVGLGAGLLVLLFISTLNAVSDLVLGYFLGIKIPQPPGLNGEGEAVSSLPELAYLLPLVVAGGALLSEILVQLIAPEAHGMSGDAVVQAYHRKKRLSLGLSAVLKAPLAGAIMSRLFFQVS